MIIEYLLTKKSDLLFDIFIILLTLFLTYWYTEEKNYIFYLKALINEIRGNISQLSETEFNKTLQEVLTRRRIWLAKGISVRVASGTDAGFLYQYLLDHAYTVFVNKGYVIKLQNCEYTKGGIFDPLAEFYLNCSHFNRESFVNEQNIVDMIGTNSLVNNNDLIELERLRRLYFNRLNEDMINSGSLDHFEKIIWDFQGKQLVIFICILLLLILIS